MATVFDEFRKEFDRMPRDEQIQLGMAGLIQMYSDDSGRGRSQMNRQFPSRGKGGGDEGMSVSGIGDTVRVHVESMDERTMDTLVSKMKKQTYNVRIVGAYSDLVDPLTHRMNSNQIKNHIFMNRLHFENVLYYRGIIEAVNNLGITNRENFMDAAVRQYHNFMRHPIWNTMRLISTTVIRPIANLASGMLFGFKKKKSDTDRIVDAIHEQTEFQRTGKIERETNMFQRLFRTGIVNTLGRNLAGFMTADAVSMASAREAREKLASNQQLSMMEKLSNRMFGKHFDVRGQEWKAAEEESYKQQVLSHYNSNEYILRRILETNKKGFASIKSTMVMSTSMSNEFAGTGTDGMGFSASGVSGRRDREEVRETRKNISDLVDISREAANDIGDIEKMQSAERFWNWIRSGMTIAASSVTHIASALGGAMSGVIGPGIGAAVGTAFGDTIKGFLKKGAIPVGLMWAGFKFSDWVLGKLGFDEEAPNQRDLFSARDKAQQDQRIVAMDKQLEELIAQRDITRNNPNYRNHPSNPQYREIFELNRSIGNLKNKRSSLLTTITEGIMANGGGSGVANTGSLSPQLTEFLKSKEGFTPVAKWDVDRFRVGYGTEKVNGQYVTRGQQITEEGATKAMQEAAMIRQRNLVRGLGDLDVTQGQLDAMTSLAYNVRGGASTVLSSSIVKRLREGDVQGAADAFLMYNRSNGEVLPGLTNRREAEREMFLGRFSPSARPGGPRVTEAAKGGALKVAAGDEGFAALGDYLGNKLDGIKQAVYDLINRQEEGTGSGADRDSVSTIMGR